MRLRNNQTLATVADIISTNYSATVISLDCATPSHEVASKDAEKSHGKLSLHIDLSESDLTDNQRAHFFPEFLKAHKDIFSTDLSGLLNTKLKLCQDQNQLVSNFTEHPLRWRRKIRNRLKTCFK